jgi:hypothetical protein
MQERELNCATIGVANRMDISGRATAEKTNRGLRIGKGRSFGRIASLTILRSLIAAGFVVALADPLAVRAAPVEAGLSRVVALNAPAKTRPEPVPQRWIGWPMWS